MDLLTDQVLRRVKATGAPHKALALDNIIGTVVEPGLSADDKAIRAERRSAWSAKADATHRSWDTLLNRAAAAGVPWLHVHQLQHLMQITASRVDL